jgi:hypothetical protein
LGQLFVPALLVGYFLVRVPQPFGAAFCFWWFGENFINISVYMSDARRLALPLVGGGDHDWNELFFRFGLLNPDSVARVSGTTHALGVLLMLVGLAWCVFFILPGEYQERIREQLSERLPKLRVLLG